ncbi:MULTISPECIES: TonB-dependent receptor [Pseudoalteromonas]|uniref:TonB-dependent receptor n=1 Tax=Pseudoalteromonas amylolytica TaxID=1859457 RepID=A0A1S1MMW8_9GAMM|nr:MULTISPECIES: TonB-dependent receptor [Pseudoalteromonas]OHU86140.1 TonB-dependent receptor [Pseudoalteromonas sp. JW3]OHU89753.1 TonB-dependent receptor [Pseudoalteromonas amylolytica]
MMPKYSLLSASIIALLSHTAVANDNNPIETIEVTGDFKRESLQTLSASASVLGTDAVVNRGANYLDQLLNSTANINFTAGASRGRFVQIRGVGLRSQFVDPIHPSVGMLIDNIDYSGLGGSALLFDVEQIAIYRGPQGTRFGADAMAGMIDVQTHAVTHEPALNVQLGVGNYSSYEAGIAAGTSLSDSTAMRASYYQHQSDGYTDNVYLNDATQTQDEQVARIKLRTQWNSTLSTELVAHHIDIDNGYDAFTLNNDRKSSADEPGQDNQQSDAFALTTKYSGAALFDVAVLISGLTGDTLYSYDEDWTCNDSSKPTVCAAGLHPYGYSSTDSYQREHERGTFELTFSDKNNNWVSGLSAKRKQVALTRAYTWQAQDFSSHYDVSHLALFGQKVTQLSDKTELVTGLRGEYYDSDYFDNNGIAGNTDDWMWGAKVALEHFVVPRTMIYTSLSRGYKIGGVNGQALAQAKDEGLNITSDSYNFTPEYLWNLEFGVKGSSEDNRHTVRVSAFYMHRDDMQVKRSIEVERKFLEFIDNATQGRNYGLEVEGNLQYTDRLNLAYSAGYLDTKVEGDFAQLTLDGREQAQAPRYQYSLAVNYQVTERLFAEVSVEGKDDYYHSISHDAKADNSNLLNASISYYANSWSLTAWGRNLADQDVEVRGFRFPNNPLKDYIEETYVQYGEPRLLGLTFKYEL